MIRKCFERRWTYTLQQLFCLYIRVPRIVCLYERFAVQFDNNNITNAAPPTTRTWLQKFRDSYTRKFHFHYGMIIMKELVYTYIDKRQFLADSQLILAVMCVVKNSSSSDKGGIWELGGHIIIEINLYAYCALLYNIIKSRYANIKNLQASTYICYVYVPYQVKEETGTIYSKAVHLF